MIKGLEPGNERIYVQRVTYEKGVSKFIYIIPYILYYININIYNNYTLL